MPLFTFLADFKGGTYVSQVSATTPYDAASQWARGQGGSSILEADALGPSAAADLIAAVEEEPVLLQGLKNTWCYSGMFQGELVLVHCIQTQA